MYYACYWEIEARYIKVKRGLESIEVKCILCHVFIMLICQFVHIWAAFTMSSAPWEGIVRPADRWHSKMCIMAYVHIRPKCYKINYLLSCCSRWLNLDSFPQVLDGEEVRRPDGAGQDGEAL